MSTPDETTEKREKELENRIQMLEQHLERLAAQAGLSKFHFHRLFTRATGMAPAKYQLHARMNEARRRLRETKESIIAVALDLGYSSPSHFAQAFRRETRMTPSEYRRQR